jgi:hypothetical protein
MTRNKGFTHIQDLLKDFKSDEDKQGLSPHEDKQGLSPHEDKQSLSSRFSQDKYISREFQKYGYDLAKELGDLKNKSLYIKLAKETPRAFLENARNYVKDAYEVQNPTALFLWKLKKLKEEMKGENTKGK